MKSSAPDPVDILAGLNDDPDLMSYEPTEYDPERRDYHQSAPAPEVPPVETRTSREEGEEREAKRLRTASPRSSRADGATFSYQLLIDPRVWEDAALSQYGLKREFYKQLNISQDDFMFGVERNVF